MQLQTFNCNWKRQMKIKASRVSYTPRQDERAGIVQGESDIVTKCFVHDSRFLLPFRISCCGVIHPSTCVKFALTEFCSPKNRLKCLQIRQIKVKWFFGQNLVAMWIKHSDIKISAVSTSFSQCHFLFGKFAKRILVDMIGFTNLDGCMMPWRRSHDQSRELRIYTYRLHEVLSQFNQYSSVSVCVAVVTIGA